MNSNHGYNHPAEGTTDWDVPLNENFQTIDTDVEVRDVEGNLGEYSPAAGAKFLATDTGKRYLGDGTQWVEAPSQPRDRVVAPSLSADPSDPVPGAVWYREDLDELRTDVNGGTVVLSQTQTVSPGTGDARTHITFDDNSYETQFTRLKGGCDGVPCEDNRRLVSSPSVSGKALEVRWRKGSHQGSAMEMDLKETWGFYPEEAWAQYYLYLDPGWVDGPQRGKFPGWGLVGSCGSGGSACNGTNGGSARGGHAPDGNGGTELTYYLYDGKMVDQGENYGDHVRWNGSVPYGEWIKIDQHIKLNTPGDSDGVLQAWVNDNRVYNNQSVYWRDSGQNFKIEKWWFSTYWGGGEPSPAENYAYFDEMKVSDEPINPNI